MSIAEIFLLWAIFSTLVVIFVYDLRHKIIPDGLAYAFAGLSLIFSLMVYFLKSGGIDLYALFLGIIAGPLLFLPFFLLWFFSKGTMMGLGDGKLALGMGWFLGISGGIAALILSFWLGTALVVFLFFLRLALEKLQKSMDGGRNRFFLGLSGFTMKSEVPFAPFLILGTAVIFFCGSHFLLSLFGF